jgi:hypothetical protein
LDGCHFSLLGKLLNFSPTAELFLRKAEAKARKKLSWPVNIKTRTKHDFIVINLIKSFLSHVWESGEDEEEGKSSAQSLREAAK